MQIAYVLPHWEQKSHGCLNSGQGYKLPHWLRYHSVSPWSKLSLPSVICSSNPVLLQARKRVIAYNTLLFLERENLFAFLLWGNVNLNLPGEKYYLYCVNIRTTILRDRPNEHLSITNMLAKANLESYAIQGTVGNSISQTSSTGM